VPGLRRALTKLQQDAQLRQRLSDNGEHEAQNHDWSVAGPRLWGPVAVAETPRERCIDVFRV
jgi:hypothetical protein